MPGIHKKRQDVVINFLLVSYIAGSNVSAYVGMVNDVLRITIPKAVAHCQVREAKRSLLDMFYTQIGKVEVLFASTDVDSSFWE